MPLTSINYSKTLAVTILASSQATVPLAKHW